MSSADLQALTAALKYRSIPQLFFPRRVPAITEPDTHQARRLRYALPGIIALMAILALWTFPFAEWVAVAVRWGQVHPLLGSAAYLAACTLGAIIFVPGSLLAMSGGYLYEMPLGMAMAAFGGALGAAAAFVCGRTFARDWVFSKLGGHPRLAALDKALYEQSFLIVMLTRLALIIPYNVLNYLYGVTGVRKGPYFFASALGLIPAMAMWAYVGALAKDFDEILSGNLETGMAGRVMFFVGLLAIILAVIVVHRTASRVLRKHLGES